MISIVIYWLNIMLDFIIDHLLHLNVTQRIEISIAPALDRMY